MTKNLLQYLCDPETGSSLTLHDAILDGQGEIISGYLQNAEGKRYPILSGIPRFCGDAELMRSVESFGDEWNALNFVDFKSQWLNYVVRNTFGSVNAFKGQVIVDAGGGSGAQTRWMLEAGAKHVILIDLSDSVDDVVQRNLKPTGFRNYDVVQASIDQPPLRAGSINGIVICHNVIQHTPSVQKTARALFSLVGNEGEFVFNCYPRFNRGFLRKLRWFLYTLVRGILKRTSYHSRLAYSKLMGVLRLVPTLGYVLEKSGLCMCGPLGFAPTDRAERNKYIYKMTVLNTFDWFGSHRYQHHLSHEELRAFLAELQPDREKIRNVAEYFAHPPLAGCALRIRQ